MESSVDWGNRNLQLLSKGSFGTTAVYLSSSDLKSDIFVLKSIDLEQIDVDDLWKQMALLGQLKHESLLCFKGIFCSGNKVYIKYPLMSYSSCSDILQQFPNGLTENVISFVLLQVASALEYLHSKGYIHRSIQGSHILVSDTGLVKLTGLRNAYCTFVDGERELHVHQYPPHIQSIMLWTAPEILAQNVKGYGCASDIYSLGITACELANGVVPFEDVDLTLMLLQKLNFVKPVLLDARTVGTMIVEDTGDDASSTSLLEPYREKHLSPAFHKFVSKCLEGNPELRLSPLTLLENSFIKTGSKVKLQDFLTEIASAQTIISSKISDSDVRHVQSEFEEMNLCSEGWLF